MTSVDAPHFRSVGSAVSPYACIGRTRHPLPGRDPGARCQCTYLAALALPFLMPLPATCLPATRDRVARGSIRAWIDPPTTRSPGGPLARRSHRGGRHVQVKRQAKRAAYLARRDHRRSVAAATLAIARERRASALEGERRLLLRIVHGPWLVQVPDGSWIHVAGEPGETVLRSRWKSIPVRRKGRMTGIRILPPGSISQGSDTDRGRSLVRGMASAGSKAPDLTPSGSEAVRLDSEALARVKAVQPYKLRSRHSGR